MKQLYGYIYIIKNDFNNKVYIGQTRTSIQERFRRHCNDKPKNNDGIDAIIKLVGQNHFFVEEIEKIPISKLNEREKYWIKYYNSYVNGYNKTLGGQGTSFFSEETIITALNDYNNNKSLQEIQQNYGIDRSALNKYRKINNVPKRAITEHELQSSINNLKNATLARQIKVKNSSLNIIYSSKKEALIDMIEKGYSKAKDWHNIRTGLDKALKDPQITFLNFKWEYVNE